MQAPPLPFTINIERFIYFNNCLLNMTNNSIRFQLIDDSLTRLSASHQAQTKLSKAAIPDINPNKK
jgi:hypothetical protein